MKRYGRFELVLILLLAITFSMVNAADSGYTGYAYERKSDESIGPKLANVNLTFIRTDNYMVYTTSTNINGYYSIKLDPAKYWVRASHASYEDYSSIPGMFVVPGPGYQIGNFFLKKPRVTTIILVRHAEKANNSSDPPLLPEGDARAQILADTAWKAGVADIYTTNTVRTKATVKYLAQKLKLDAKIYNTPQEVANTVSSEHNGDTVLIAGHSDTVAMIANQFGAAINTGAISDFDNFYVITRKKASTGAITTNVLNFQYGADSTPDITKGAYPMKTVLLLRHAETGAGANPSLNPSGQARAQELVHVVKKAGITVIYTTASNRAKQTVQPLEILAKLNPVIKLKFLFYDPNNLLNLVSQIKNETAKNILVVADSDKIAAIIKKLNGNPLPPIWPNEYDTFFVITLFADNDANVVGFQYGAASP
jgi:broad specificity phosphatase PhoE